MADSDIVAALEANLALTRELKTHIDGAVVGVLKCVVMALHAVDTNRSATRKLRQALREFWSELTDEQRNDMQFVPLQAFLMLLEAPPPGRGPATVVPLRPKGAD
jgi:hypothetical protein